MENLLKTTILSKSIRHLCRRAFLLGGVTSMIGMILLILYDVGMRNLFNRPLMSSYELVMFLMAIVVFTSLPYTQSERNIVKIELLISHLPKRAQAFLEILTSFLSLSLFLLITWRNVIRSIELRQEHLVSPILYIPVFPFYLVVAFGSILLSLILFVEIIESLNRFASEK